MQNQQNIAFYSVQSLDLNFKRNKNKKQQTKKYSKTDRKNNQTVFIQQDLKSQRTALIEKKKNYSEAIRERNLNLLSKKRLDHENNYQLHTQSKEQISIKNLQSPKTRINKSSSCFFKKKSIGNLKLSDKNKQQKSINILEFDPIPFNVQSSYNPPEAEQHNLNTDFQKKYEQQTQERYIHQEHQQKSSRLQKNSTSNLSLCSYLYHEKILVLDSDTTLLTKQNNTFKRDLTNFRKQNSQLRNQLKVAQNHIQQLQQKAKNILQGSLIASYRPSQEITELEDKNSCEFDNNLEIIQRLRQQIQELRHTNSNLQLRTYMAEKKIVQQVSLCRKKMAKQLNQWRNKCTKLRAENLKYKSLRDTTISMQISKDQQ